MHRIIDVRPSSLVVALLSKRQHRHDEYDAYDDRKINRLESVRWAASRCHLMRLLVRHAAEAHKH